MRDMRGARFAGEGFDQLMLADAAQAVQLVLVVRDVEVGDDFAAVARTLVDGGPVVGPSRLLLGGEKAQVDLLAADVDLGVPFLRLLEQ